MSSTREHILETTCDLLEAQGYHATGLSQIIAASGTPKGSLYYYFPGGKEELAAEAIERTGQLLAGRIRNGLSIHERASEAVCSFVQRIASAVETSGFRAGGPLTTVAMETVNTSERLNHVCREAYQQLQQTVEEKLLACDYGTERAKHLAIFIISSIEGGIILSRTEHSGAPLRHVAEELGFLLEVYERGDKTGHL